MREGAGGSGAAVALPARISICAGVVGVCLLALFANIPVAPNTLQRDGLTEAATWRVVVVDVETAAELWAAPVRKGDVVVYEYTHSADKTPIQSWLRVESAETGFVLERERYLWYGAGLEFRADYGVVLEDDWVVVYAERSVPRLVMRVAGTVEQSLSVGRYRTTFNELAPFGRRILLEVRP